MDAWKVAVLPGDGIGPEVVDAAIKVIESVNRRFKIAMTLNSGEAGLHCIGKYGTNLPEDTIKLLRESSCVIKGPMTTPEEPGSETSAAVKIRKMFRLYADVRPAKNLPGVPSIKEGIDLVIVRENTEGMYSGAEFAVSDQAAVGLRVITKEGSRRIGRFAFEMASRRKRHLTIVHKANILKISDGLLKNTILALGVNYRNVKVDDAHVDAMAQWLIKQPELYDIIVTENLFGDILSDEASMLVGGIGVGPSANIGDDYAMFEPVHGSAPKYAGKDRANPVGTILSVKMMYEWMGYGKAAAAIEKAVETAIKNGIKTRDLGGKYKCSEVGEGIAGIISRIRAR